MAQIRSFKLDFGIKLILHSQTVHTPILILMMPAAYAAELLRLSLLIKADCPPESDEWTGMTHVHCLTPGVHSAGE